MTERGDIASLSGAAVEAVWGVINHNGIVMKEQNKLQKEQNKLQKEQSKFQVHARKYHTLARGYAALNSKLAEPAKGAAKAYRLLADELELDKTARDQQGAQTASHS